MTIRLNSSTSGYTELDAPAVGGNNTLRLPGDNGTSGYLMQTDGSGNLSWRDPSSLLSPYRNRIINGDMRISQRGATSFSTVSAFYGGADRWRTELYNFSTASGSITQAGSLGNTSSLISSGFVHEVQATTTGAGSLQFVQRIEAQNCNDLNGKTITVSFVLYQDTGSAVTPYVQILKPNAVDNWSTVSTIATSNLASLPSTTRTKYTFTTTLGSSDATNGLGVSIGFTLGAVTGKYFQLSDVQLEPGSVATPFERRSYGAELALCQRYYESSYPLGYSPGFNFAEEYPFSTSRPVAINLIASDDTTVSQTIRFVVQKRAAPTVTIYSAKTGATGNTWTYKGSGYTNLNWGANVTYTSQDLWNINQGLSAVNQANESYFHFTASAEL